MPMPRWVAKVNKRVFNPLEVRRGARPVLVHVGRSSGATYETPLDAIPVDGGYLVMLVYGPRTDWLRNVLASGTATLRIEGDEVALANPRVIGAHAARSLLPDSAPTPPRLLGISEYLRMDVAD
jgi:deazaflavin-dependent oxidoreductase (nitroreductase family)